jgi:hypothetical protein
MPWAKDANIQVGDVVVSRGGIGGPCTRVLGFGHASRGLSVGPTAKLESLLRDPDDPTRAAWTAELPISTLRTIPEEQALRMAPCFYDFEAR